ncbi:DUF3164 family protein, partial [Fusobacterium sp.]|uniref:DUF3164 family protein n=1 Tax=Fusobacterium sp. TaxID=68766 RepID=UPI0026231B32
IKMMVDLKNLTTEQKKALFEEIKKEEREKEKRKAEARETYKNLVAETVERNFKKLEGVSEMLSQVKKAVYEDFKTALEMKAELFGVKENQQTHTFTTAEGLTITIGHRVTDNFDDTVHAGIEKVKGYISKVTAGEKAELEELINLLLKKDKNGNLKASRVLELERIAEKINDEELKDGVQIIKEAYKPTKTSTFIEAYYKDEQGKKVYLPLSIVNAEG